jgi:hypothetical protein
LEAVVRKGNNYEFKGEKQMLPTRIDFEEMYSDNSGVERAVRMLRPRKESDVYIEFEAVNKVRFHINDLGWLIQCLCQILEEFKKEMDNSAKMTVAEFEDKNSYEINSGNQGE